MVPGNRPLIDMIYKYNIRNVLSFIDTEDAGITQDGFTYLYKYPDLFYNIAIHPFSLPLVIYKLLGPVNYVEPNKKYRQYGLALEKYWVTQCSWIQLYT